MPRNIEIREIEAKHALGKSGMKELDYAYNPYLGCFHGCRYCYAIDMAPSDASSSWGNIVYARTNIITKLKQEMPGLKRGIVGISTITDPYQFIERKYGLAGEGIRLLALNGFHVTIQTKSPMVIKDIKTFIKYKKMIDIGITVTTLNNSIAALIEPFAPSPESRLKAIKKLSDNGIAVWLYLGPIIRNLNDNIEEIEGIIKFCSSNKIRIIYDSYQNYNGPSKYMEGTGYMVTEKGWWLDISSKIQSLCLKYGIDCTRESEEWKYEQDRKQRKLF
ncbi:MAG: radical SAM protein [Ferroplasma sp.]